MSALPLLLASAVLTACAESTGPAAQASQTSVIQLEGYPAAAGVERDRSVRWDIAPADDDVLASLLVPDSARAGEPFEVTVKTIGQGGCWSAAGENVTVTSAALPSVHITPLDMHSGADVCTRILAFLPHTFVVIIPTPGQWIVRVVGRRARHGHAEWYQPVAAEKAIIVR